MEAMGMMRDLDQIRERDDGRETSRLALIAVGGLAAACVLFAAGVLIGRDGDPGTRQVHRGDPLARLDALANEVADAGAPVVTYPDRLVDGPSAALAIAPAALTPTAANLPAPSLRVATANPASVIDGVVRARSPQTLGAAPSGPFMRIAPSGARDGIQLASSGITAAQSPAAAATAPAGSDGAFTLQVSSFRTLSTAQSFAQRLRERGHRAFVSSTPASAGGPPWHRVRIGPFASLRDASRYRADFEARERLPTFVVHLSADTTHNG